MTMSYRYAAFLSLLLFSTVANRAHADLPPGNRCTVPGQPCMNACPTTLCNQDGGNLPGVCTTFLCRRYGPVDAGPDSDGGVVIGWMDYPCNLCVATGAPDGGDDAAPDHMADATDADEADEAGADAGGSDGAGGTSGSAGTGGAAGTTGSGGSGGAGGTSGSGGAAGIAGTPGTGGSGPDTGPSDTGCSCIFDGDRWQRRSNLSALSLVGVLGYYLIRRRANRVARKDRRLH